MVEIIKCWEFRLPFHVRKTIESMFDELDYVYVNTEDECEYDVFSDEEETILLVTLDKYGEQI